MKIHSPIDLICKAIGIPVFCAGVTVFIMEKPENIGEIAFFVLGIELLFLGMMLINDWE